MAKVKRRYKIVIISGVTASGKSDLGLELAHQFNGEIVSADSRQVYKFLDIGTAKLMPDEREGIEHYCIDIVDPRENQHYSVADYQRDCYAAIEEIIKKDKIPFIVGGTGLYTRAVAEGYSFDPNVPNNPRYDVLQICLISNDEELNNHIRIRIDTRTKHDMMFKETKQLLEMGVKREFLDSLGLEYRLNLQYLDGKMTLDEYKEELFKQTRDFVKRQRTWYRKENKAYTHYFEEYDDIIETCIALVGQFLGFRLVTGD